jgi:hypothetical protein
LIGTTAACPGCSKPIAVPLVDKSVAGFDKIVDCVLRSTSPPPTQGHATTAEPSSARDGNLENTDQRLARSPFANASPRQPDNEQVLIPEVVQPNSASASIVAGSRINPRVLRLGCYYGIWLGPIAFLFVALALDGSPVIAFVLTGAFLAVPWYFLGRLVASRVTPAILAAAVRTIRCPGCQEEIQAVNRWFCSCGYHDHRERNVFLYRCPKCTNRIGHTTCPQCDSTILL